MPQPACGDGGTGAGQVQIYREGSRSQPDCRTVLGAGRGGDAVVVRAMGGWGRPGAVGTRPGTVMCGTVLWDMAGIGAGTAFLLSPPAPHILHVQSECVSPCFLW